MSIPTGSRLMRQANLYDQILRLVDNTSGLPTSPKTKTKVNVNLNYPIGYTRLTRLNGQAFAEGYIVIYDRLRSFLVLSLVVISEIAFLTIPEVGIDEVSRTACLDVYDFSHSWLY